MDQKSEYQRSLNDKDSEIRDLKKKLAEQESAAAMAISAREQYVFQLTTITREKSQFETENYRLKDSVEKFAVDNSARLGKLEEYKIENEKLKREVEHSNKQLEQNAASFQSSIESVQKIAQENLDNQTKKLREFYEERTANFMIPPPREPYPDHLNQKWREDNANLHQQVQILQNSITEYHNQDYVDKQLSVLQKKIDTLELINAQLRSDLDHYQAQLDQKRSELSKVHLEMSDSQSVSHKLKIAYDASDLSKRQLAELESNFRETSAQIARYANLLQEYEHTIRDKEEMIKKLEGDLSVASDHLSRSQREQQVLMGHVNRFRAEIQRYRINLEVVEEFTAKGGLPK